MSLPSLLIRKLKGARSVVRRKFNEKRIPGTEIGERVEIYDLVCPLRYDILVRADFIELLAKNEDLSKSELGRILENPAGRAYQTWFKEVAVRRFQSTIYRDEDQIRERFHKRVESLQKLWQSMRTRGFDPEYPVKLGSGGVIQAVNGKTFATSMFARNGCHRLACLLVMGKTHLEPEEYEVAWAREFRPLDNTSILLKELPLSMSDYLPFISRGYCGGRAVATADDVIAHVKEHCPERLAELESVFRHDLVQMKEA